MKKFILTFLIFIPLSASAAWYLPWTWNDNEARTGDLRVLTVPQGGTGAATFTEGQCLIGHGTGVVTSGDCGTGTGSSFDWPFDVSANYVSTTTTLGLLSGLFSTASSTLTNLQTGLANGLAYIGTGRLLSVATSSAIDLSILGNAGTATTLAANGANCSAGQAAGGVSATGVAEDCTTYLQSESDPVVKALSGIVTSNGSSLSARTLATSSDKIIITNPGGIAGNPTFDIRASSLLIGTDVKAGTLTDTKTCTWDNGNSQIVCNTTPTTGTVTSVATTWPITGGTFTTSGTLGFGGLSTSSAAVIGNIPYFSGVNTFANVATGTISASGGITVTASRYAIGGAAAFACTSASGSATGCLSSANWNTFNNKIGTSTTPTLGQLMYWGGTATVPAANSVATGTIACTGLNSCTTTGLSVIGGNLTISGAYDAFSHPLLGWSATSSSMMFGTTTDGLSQLTVSSSTKPQLSLSSGAGFSQFSFRNVGGTFYLSTTTVAGTATTSTAALEIQNQATTTLRNVNGFDLNNGRGGLRIIPPKAGSSTTTLEFY